MLPNNVSAFGTKSFGYSKGSIRAERVSDAAG
jgi:hypothetical protein